MPIETENQIRLRRAKESLEIMEAIIHPWHNPHNDACAQNADINADCTCTRKRQSKGYRVCRIVDRNTPSGIQPEIILEIHPNGVLVFREKRKRRSYETTAGRIFANLVWKEAMQTAQLKRKNRKKK